MSIEGSVATLRNRCTNQKLPGESTRDLVGRDQKANISLLTTERHPLIAVQSKI